MVEQRGLLTGNHLIEKLEVKNMSKGASEIATMALYVGISVAAISGAMTVGIPALENQQEAASIQKAQQFMQTLDSNIQEVVAEGEGSTRTLRLNLERGRLFYDNDTNSLIYELESDAPVISPQASRSSGNVILSSNADVSVKETTVGGTECFLMENEHIRTCIKKVGAQNNPESINTSELLVLYEFKSDSGNKQLNADMTVELNDQQSTSYGEGYTYAPDTGEFIGTGEVVATVSTSTFTYDVIYQLPTGADFIKVDVQNFR